MDRRSRRTRDALQSAFVKLVLTCGYEAVTIGEICDAGNVGRSTFYAHYKSKADLLEESLQGPSAGLAACASAEATRAGLLPLLAHFSEQKRVNRIFFEPPVRTIWVRTLARLIAARQPRGARSELKSLVVAEMQLALLSHWLTGRFSVQPEAVAAMLIANTQALLTAPAQPSP